ncbi:hypothetical protein ON010_g8185 [Phytophthora cinnamomi]|nr:hypothetical protein ON010_g8185 [Phytophthora cinnamomi]
MGKFRLPEALPDIQLSPERQAALIAEVDAVVQHTLELRGAFAAGGRQLDKEAWKHVKTKDDVRAYRSRRALHGGASHHERSDVLSSSSSSDSTSHNRSTIDKITSIASSTSSGDSDHHKLTTSEQSQLLIAFSTNILNRGDEHAVQRDQGEEHVEPLDRALAHALARPRTMVVQLQHTTHNTQHTQHSHQLRRPPCNATPSTSPLSRTRRSRSSATRSAAAAPRIALHTQAHTRVSAPQPTKYSILPPLYSSAPTADDAPARRPPAAAWTPPGPRRPRPGRCTPPWSRAKKRKAGPTARQKQEDSSHLVGELLILVAPVSISKSAVHPVAYRKGRLLSMARQGRQYERIAPESNAAEDSGMNSRTLSVDSWDGFRLGTIGASALHTATWRGDDRVVEYLLEEGQDPDTKDTTGMTPIMLVIMYHNLQATRFDLIWTRHFPMTYVIYACSVAAVKSLMLLCGGQEGKSPLYHCIQGPSLQVGDLLMENRAQINLPDKDGVTPLQLMIRKEDVNMLQVIINHHHFVPMDGGEDFSGSVLVSAIDQGALSVVAFLLDEAYVEVGYQSANGETAMHRAMLKSRPEVAERLRTLDDQGQALSLRTVTGESCFHYAARYSPPDELQHLLEFYRQWHEQRPLVVSRTGRRCCAIVGFTPMRPRTIDSVVGTRWVVR